MYAGYRRFLIGWAPTADSALGRFGAAWTAHCVHACDGAAIRVPEWMTALRDDADIGAIGQRGFFAALTVPVSVRGCDRFWQMSSNLSALAEGLAHRPLPPFTVTVRGGRVTLVPRHGSRRLAAVMGSLTGVMRACGPASMEPLAAAGEMLPGAPAIPLTEPMPTGRAWCLAFGLRHALDPVLSQRWPIDEFALLGDPGMGRPWRVIERYEIGNGLGSGPVPMTASPVWADPVPDLPPAPSVGQPPLSTDNILG